MLGDELRKARLKGGLTQEQVAAQARISREYVSQLERNRQSPTVDMLFRVCRILEVSASRLLAKVEKAGPGNRPAGDSFPLSRRR
jgi:transcriptional regulator with XRE-family HTH domain